MDNDYVQNETCYSEFYIHMNATMEEDWALT
jgi:hypothetical protein